MGKLPREKKMRVKGFPIVTQETEFNTISIRYKTYLPVKLTNEGDSMWIFASLGFSIIQSSKFIMEVLLPEKWHHIKHNKEEFLVDELGRKRFLINKKDKTMTGINRFTYQINYMTDNSGKLFNLNLSLVDSTGILKTEIWTVPDRYIITLNDIVSNDRTAKIEEFIRMWEEEIVKSVVEEYYPNFQNITEYWDHKPEGFI